MILYETCVLKATEESFLQINYSLQENEVANPFTSSVAAKAAQLGKIRRLAIYLDENTDRLVSSRDETNGHVRSLLFFGLRDWIPKSEKGLLSPLKDFKVLRVLKVEGLSKVEVELPSEIGNMVHLRLTNLRKLKIRLSSSLQNLEEILKSTGSTLNRIRSLIVFVDNNSGEGQAMQIVSSCRSIYKLRLDGPIAELPKELHNYPNLTKLQLWQCGLKEDQMGILETLPNLTTLCLGYNTFHENTKILVFSKGGFPSLEFLSVSSMFGITEWRAEEGAMPCLCRLEIEYCWGLTTLPDGLRYLTNLRELTIRAMPRALHRRIEEDGEDFYKIQHVPSLVIGEPYEAMLAG
ncbi:putative disease resistance protein [Prunus yedoensis var. nudiflora]|uniref:Putative disease resistance protein n=1 Tax=Prunus yedoensis var. nudiflora TaxID=2094558 RepID=A0A314ZGA8_PRUYE|nr:putative disease resistance protein [Prunus yedoensis var. nudiflora]